MSTLKEANEAREQHSEYLQKDLGAHAILVDKVKEKGKDTFGVIALSEQVPQNPPKSLEIVKGGKKMKVPLRVAKTRKAKLE